MLSQHTGEDGFRWFIGVVEDINDPLRLGRARVRIVNEHDDVVTENIPWAHILMPTTSACLEGVGETPYLLPGTRVVGFFMDSGEKQLPMVIGSFPTIPDNNENIHSLSWLARGKNTITKQKLEGEPDSAYAAQYPNNRVIQSKSGHVIELDDTPENTRIHIYHNSGTYIEINNDGRIVIKTVTDSIDLTTGQKTISTGTDLDIKTGGTTTIASKESLKIAAPGGVTITEGSLFVKGSIGSAIGATGAFTTTTGQTVHVQNGLVTLIK